MTQVNIIALTRITGYEGIAERLAKQTGMKFVCLTRHEDLCPEVLDTINPSRIFLPHWSHLIPGTVFSRYECIIFHMTDVPFGRGGSPLQNLISRGICTTKICAIKCIKELDAGPVYLKRPFSLESRAQEIFERAARVIEEMIADIIKSNPTPTPQEGPVVKFTRRTRDQSTILGIDSAVRLYDHIRMLDAEGYPSAFLETENFRLEFNKATLEKDQVRAEVVFIPR